MVEKDEALPDAGLFVIATGEGELISESIFNHQKRIREAQLPGEDVVSHGEKRQDSRGCTRAAISVSK